MAAKFALIKTVRGIEENIDLLKKSGKSYQLKLHQVAASCLNHVAEHNDTRLLNKLISVVPTGFRSNAIRSWAEHYGNVTWSADKKALVYDKAKKPNIEGAIRQAPWEFKPEPAYRPFNLIAMLQRVVKQAEQRVDELNAEAQEKGITLETLMDEKGDAIDVNLFSRIKGMVEREADDMEPDATTLGDVIETAPVEPAKPRTKAQRQQANATVN